MTAVDTLCAAYGSPIFYSGSKDTNETKRQVREKNQTFENLGCFGKLPSK